MASALVVSLAESLVVAEHTAALTADAVAVSSVLFVIPHMCRNHSGCFVDRVAHQIKNPNLVWDVRISVGRHQTSQPNSNPISNSSLVKQV